MASSHPYRRGTPGPNSKLASPVRTGRRIFAALLLIVAGFAGAAEAKPAPARPRPMAAVANPCPRPTANSEIGQPSQLVTSGGVLQVAFSFQTRKDSFGRVLYCFMTASGLQNPTLFVNPGDTLIVTVTNNTPSKTVMMRLNAPNCGPPGDNQLMNWGAVNLHYHGTNTSPACGSDEVIKTFINPGRAFTYRLSIPFDEPPGMYWYHPHIHGISDPVVLGGATGAIIVRGIENFQPGLRGLREQYIVLRDQTANAGPNEGPGNCGNGVPFRDVTVNNVPVNSIYAAGPVLFVPARLTVRPGQAEFWRVANTSADSILDLRVVYDGVQQTLRVVAIDGVPVNSQDGTSTGPPIPVKNFRLPPAGRVEFVVTTPTTSVRKAQLITQNINTGPDGDCDPTRPLVQILPSAQASTTSASGAEGSRDGPLVRGNGRRFAGLAAAPVTAQRTVFFAENNPAGEFYMTVQGQANRLYSPNMPPGIVTTKGAVEQWIVQNRTRESHEFHIHQIHFLVQGQNFQPQAPGITGQYLDMIDVPPWSGSGPYPSVTLLMDFRGAVVGSFVFHCHILNHEDGGMMNIVQVNAGPTQSSGKSGKRSP